ncbi:Nramp-domain-containing protein [Hesseltinella vesiculosa]|uniref:Nramp-domain-containing protein n=1 Tax=Hesseltinella vesiculosa TaxID=101127 RepID=A0A1X2GVN9_9FUNG|nr:Nramp-domain-containing protein [Hesseltinella vesiculosa]
MTESDETTTLCPASSSHSYQSLEASAWDVEIDIKDQVDTGEVDSDNRFSWSKLLKYMGPGWLMAIAYLDPGNLESDLQTGAIAGYQLLWLLFWCHAAGLAIQTLAIRLGVVTGKHLAQHIRQAYDGRTAKVIWFFSQCAIIGSDIQEIVGTAIALRIFFNLPIWAGVLITATDTFFFMWLQQFGVRKIEAFFMSLIGIMVACFFTEMISSGPDIGAIVEGMWLPRIPTNATVQAVGMIGCLLMPHDLYLHSALVGSRFLGPSPSAAKKKEANFYFTLESALALLTSYCINLAIVVVFAQVYYQAPLPTWMTSDGPARLPGLYDAAEVLERTLGPMARYLWAAGLLAAGQSSTMTGTLAGQYVMEGFFGKFFKKQWHRMACTRAVALIPSMLVALYAADRFDTMGELLNVVQSLCLPMAIIPLLKLTSSETVMTPDEKNGGWMNTICWMLSVVVIGFNGSAFMEFLQAWDYHWLLLCLSVLYFGFVGYILYLPLGPSRVLDTKPSSHSHQQ